MIRILAPAVAALALPAAASAQLVDPVPGRLDIVGLAPSACLIRTPLPATGDNMSFQTAGNAAGQITILETVDAATAQPRGGSLDLILPVVCNSPHRVVLRSRGGGMRPALAAAEPGPFAQLLSYSVDAAWGPSEARMTTAESGTLIIDSAGARAGQLSLSFSIAPGGQPLLAGPYSDEIILELQAAN